MTAPGRSSRHPRVALLLLAITALGGFLRFCQIGSKGLWIDEAFSIWMSERPIGEMLGWLVRIDQHPPLYYALLHLWMRLGDRAATVRSLSVLASTLTIPAIYLLGRRLANEKAGALSALLLAISPFHVRFAQEARMYALLTLNASLALVALAWLLTDRRAAEDRVGRQLASFWRTWRARRRRPPVRAIETDLAWLGYVFFTTATLLCHNTAVFFPIATNALVFGLYASGRVRGQQGRNARDLSPPSPRNWLAAQAGVGLLWLPWLPAFAVQAMGVYREFWLPAPTLETVAGVVSAFVSDFLAPGPAAAVAMGALYAGLALAGWMHFRRRPACVGFLAAVFLTPFVGEWLVSLRRPIFYSRTLIWASIPLYILLAAGACRQRRSVAVAVVTLMLSINGLSLREYYVNFEKEAWDQAAAFVAEQVEPDDLILFNATWAQIPFDYYFHREYNGPVAERGLPVDLFDRSVLEPRMHESDLPRLRTLIQAHRRVWLVYSHDWYTDPEGLIPAALDEELERVDRWDFRGLQVWLYVSPQHLPARDISGDGPRAVSRRFQEL